MRNCPVAALASLLLLTGLAASSQTPDTDKVRLLQKQLAQQKHLMRDWGGLLHYGSDNTELPPPAAGESRVIFLGDEITEDWGQGMSAPFFPGRPYLNRGVKGQTSSQMLLRFRQDVVELQPKVVVILAGMNDIAGINGPATEEMVAENLASMSELARVHGIRVVLASVLPVCDCFERSVARQRRQGRIVELNEAIEELAGKNEFFYLDYYSAMVDSGGLAMKKELTIDGILPDEAGYRVMALLAEQAIARALGKK